MTDYAGLVERLHQYAKSWIARAGSKDIVDEAATAIEELQRALVSAEIVCDSYALENQQFHDRFEKAERERDEAVAIAASNIDAIIEAKDLVTRSDARRNEYPSAPIRVVVDEAIPEGEAHFRDHEGRVVGRIVNVGPSAPTREPTEAMIVAGDEAIIAALNEHPSDVAFANGTPAERCWKAMQEARPTAPSGGRGEAVAEVRAILREIKCLGCGPENADWSCETAAHRALTALSAIGTGEDERLTQADAVIHALEHDTVWAQSWKDEAIARHASRQAKPPCE